MISLSSITAAALSIGLGLCLLMGHEWVARSALEWDYRALGVAMDEKMYRLVFAIGGLGLIVIGLLGMSGILALEPSW